MTSFVVYCKPGMKVAKSPSSAHSPRQLVFDKHVETEEIVELWSTNAHWYMLNKLSCHSLVLLNVAYYAIDPPPIIPRYTRIKIK